MPGSRCSGRPSSVVDSPGVNEPEQHLSVRDLVTEDLALIPRRHRGALRSTPWLKVNRFEDIAGLWTEQLPAGRRIELLTALALANPDTDLLVVDSPDRHSGDPADWLPRLEELAHDAGRPLAVVATVARIPDGWTGPAAVIGNAVPLPPHAMLTHPRTPSLMRRRQKRHPAKHRTLNPPTRNRGRKVTVLRLARSELKRMTGGLLPKLTILALALVPLLYGAVYLYANWDPYGKLNQIDAALVVQDSGAAAADGTRLEAGRKVAESLVDGHVFNWKTVASTEEADQGVSNGTYAFALKIPQDFSANLVSPGSFDAANQAMLNVTTNDANNYLLSTIVDKLTTAVHTTVAKEVGEETANQLLTGFGTIHTQMLKASDGAAQLADGVARLHDGTVTLHQGTGELKTGATELVQRRGQAPRRRRVTQRRGRPAQQRPHPAQGQDGGPARRRTAAGRRRRPGGCRQRRAQHPDAGHPRAACRRATGRATSRRAGPAQPGGGVHLPSGRRRGPHPGAGRQGSGRRRRHPRAARVLLRFRVARPPPNCRPPPRRSRSWPTVPPPSAPAPRNWPAPRPPSATPSPRPPPGRTSSPAARRPSPPASRTPSTAPAGSCRAPRNSTTARHSWRAARRTASDGAGTLAAELAKGAGQGPQPRRCPEEQPLQGHGGPGRRQQCLAGQGRVLRRRAGTVLPDAGPVDRHLHAGAGDAARSPSARWPPTHRPGRSPPAAGFRSWPCPPSRRAC